MFGRCVIFLVLLLILESAPAALIVDTDWLAARLDDPNVVIVDMSAEDLQYQRFHIPGAVRLPYQALVRKRPDGVAVSIGDEPLYRLLGGLGIGAETQVVVYDDVGGLNAGRLFWELERIGHPAVSVLNGGLVEWILEGRSVHTGATFVRPRAYRPSGRAGRVNEAGLEQVAAAVASGRPLLLDVRTAEEYPGVSKGTTERSSPVRRVVAVGTGGPI